MVETGVLMLVLLGFVAILSLNPRGWSDETRKAFKWMIVVVGISTILIGINSFYPIPYAYLLATAGLLVSAMRLIFLVVTRM